MKYNAFVFAYNLSSLKVVDFAVCNNETRVRDVIAEMEKKHPNSVAYHRLGCNMTDEECAFLLTPTNYVH